MRKFLARGENRGIRKVCHRAIGNAPLAQDAISLDQVLLFTIIEGHYSPISSERSNSSFYSLSPRQAAFGRTVGFLPLIRRAIFARQRRLQIAVWPEATGS
jgi:hypothetical protein